MMYYHQTIYVLIKKKKSYFSALQLQYSIHESIRIAFKKKTKKKTKTSLPSMVVEILKAIQEESR